MIQESVNLVLKNLKMSAMEIKRLVEAVDTKTQDGVHGDLMERVRTCWCMREGRRDQSR
jgi:hypothetical protein